MSEAVAQSQAEALAKRVREQNAAPGSEAALRRHIEGLQRDEPNFDDTAPALAAAAQSQWSAIKTRFGNPGPLQSITFKAVAPSGADIYEVRFEKRTVEWRILLNPAGKVEALNFQPASSADPVPLKHFELLAGDARETLNDFSRQADLRLLFDFSRLPGLHTQAVSGDFGPVRALALMLAGQCLDFVFVNDRTIAITPASRDCVPTTKAASPDTPNRDTP